jgi:hypothetical protein
MESDNHPATEKVALPDAEDKHTAAQVIAAAINRVANNAITPGFRMLQWEWKFSALDADLRSVYQWHGANCTLYIGPQRRLTTGTGAEMIRALGVSDQSQIEEVLYGCVFAQLNMADAAAIASAAHGTIPLTPVPEPITPGSALDTTLQALNSAFLQQQQRANQVPADDNKLNNGVNSKNGGQ